MASQQKIYKALMDFQRHFNSNWRLREMLCDWSRLVHFRANDKEDAKFTVTVVKGEITEIRTGLEGKPDIVLTTDSETLLEIFWSHLDPTEGYISGQLLIDSSEEDLLRLDAITELIWAK